MNYHTIIVGAGSAGAVLAARLTEASAVNILLIEAGPDYSDPATAPADILNSRALTYAYDWGFMSQPVGHDRRIPLRRSKVTGGCSATNACMALRGAPSDYDAWRAAGNIGWSYQDVLPYMMKLENDVDIDSEIHNHDGPIPIRRYPKNRLTEVQSAFVDAAIACGYPTTSDHNNPDSIGVGPIPMNTMDGVRMSTALTYLKAAHVRNNCFVRDKTLVDRVLFDGTKAIGVEVVSESGDRESILAQRIILSAGSYASAAILMRTGIGDAKVLDDIGIPCVNNLVGVGNSLQDHLLVGFPFAVNKSIVVDGAPNYQACLTLKSDQQQNANDLVFFPISASAVGNEKSPTGAMASLVIGLTKPMSQGWMRITTHDPHAHPEIQPGYFTHPFDMPRMIDGVRQLLTIARSYPLSALLHQPIGFNFDHMHSDDEIENYILNNVGTYHHPVGTCKMGTNPGTDAVVDNHCAVYGTENLYVIDASIMPEIPSVNTNIPTIMIAERCMEWL